MPYTFNFSFVQVTRGPSEGEVGGYKINFNQLKLRSHFKRFLHQKYFGTLFTYTIKCLRMSADIDPFTYHENVFIRFVCIDVSLKYSIA